MNLSQTYDVKYIGATKSVGSKNWQKRFFAPPYRGVQRGDIVVITPSSPSSSEHEHDLAQAKSEYEAWKRRIDEVIGLEAVIAETKQAGKMTGSAFRITRVANGWILSESDTPNYTRAPAPYVFTSAVELAKFIEERF